MAHKTSRVQRKTKSRHRAHKRDSVAAQPVGKGRDARKREKRAVIHARHNALAADAVQAVKDREDAAVLAALEAEEAGK